MNNFYQQLWRDFDQTPTHWQSDSQRWQTYQQGVLPLWVADMDFAIAKPIREALTNRLHTAPLWYVKTNLDHNQVVCDYLYSRYDWQVAPDSVLWLPGLMCGIYQSISLLPNDAQVLVATPVYQPLTLAAQLRKAHQVAMVQTQGKWQWQLPSTLPRQTEALLFCHPHNPTGKVFSAEELSAIGEYARTHQLLVISDEIHADLTLDGIHRPFASICPEHGQHTLTFMSAGKTFNIAGLGCAFAIVENRELRATLQQRIQLCGSVSFMGVIATLAAFREGEQWREALLGYLRANRNIINDWVATHPTLDWITNQATHLAWIDTSKVGEANIHTKLVESGLALSAGHTFGDSNYMRLNYATPKSRLQQALERFASVCE